MESKFKELSVIDCGEYIETIPQGNRKLSYISWSDAWQLLKEKCPDANYEHHEPVTFSNGEMMVFCTVTVSGVSHRMHLPVLGNKNQPLKNPNVFDINTSMQRCFAKAISMHGLGLYVYRGEDLPPTEAIDDTAMYEEFMRRYEENKHGCAVWYSQLSEEEMSAVKEGSPKNKKTATHQLSRDLVTQMHANFDDYAEQLSIAVQKEDVTSVGQLWNEMVDYERRCVFGRLSQEVQASLNNLIKRAIALKEQSNV
jgi:hypothetical protein